MTVPDLMGTLAELKVLAANSQSDEEMRSITSRIAQLSRSIRVNTGIGLPRGPLEQAMDLDTRFRPEPHLEYLSSEIVRAVHRVERGQNQKLLISLPPRSGKTELISKKTPLWILRRHPDWKIVLSSYDGALTGQWARSIRTDIERSPELGIALAQDGGAGGQWNTIEGGGMFSTSVRGGLTGRGARMMIIDDPIKDFVDAHSLPMRQHLWDWWLSVALTRLEPPYLVMVVMCMTGDTPVLRPDGSETPLGDIRPGDQIATYERGRLATSTVRNWANQGPDNIYEIRMESGRTVRANARHPFLTVDENGVETWRRTDSLGPGSLILTATGESGTASSAQPRAVTYPLAVEASAPRTIPRPGGRPVIVQLPVTPSLAELRGSSIGTESLSRSTTRWLRVRKADVRSAMNPLLMDPRIGEESSASTTTMPRESSGVSSATTAISFSRSTSIQGVSAPPLTTWNVTPDRVVEVIPAGREDVFDLQVDRTENFIANGLVSHNTRWHEDDFIGRLLSPDYEGDPKEWRKIILPAIAEENDALGREVGDPLTSPMISETRSTALQRWDDVKRVVGGYTFSAMYQQRPAPAKGAIFDVGWWRYWTSDPSLVTDDGRVVYVEPGKFANGDWIDSWDCAFGQPGAGRGGWVVGQRWVRNGANRYLISQIRDRWGFVETLDKMTMWSRPDDEFASPHGHLVNTRLIEAKANGTAIIEVFKEKIAGIKPINPTTSKEARARAVTPEIESGNVYLPLPSYPGNEWVTDFLSEVRNFPNDAADDQVDALTQALSYLRIVGRGSITIPGGNATRRRAAWQVPQDIARAAMTDLNQRRDR